MSEVNEKLLLQLECPVCLNYMTPPITLCTTGHSLCGSCSKILTECGLCKKPLSSTRNFALEHISSVLLLPCPNEGCKETMKSNELKDHEENCQYRNYKCLLGDFTGPMNKIVDHWKISHKETYESGIWLIAENLKENKKIILLITSNDQFYFCLFKSEHPKYYFNVQYIGQPKEAKLHRYEIKLGDYNNETGRQIVLKNHCQSADLTIDELLNGNGEFCLDWKTIETLVTPIGLSFIVIV